MSERAGQGERTGTVQEAATQGAAAQGRGQRACRTLLDAAAEALALLEPLPGMHGVPAEDYRVIEANAAFRRITGIAPEPVHGGGLRELLADAMRRPLFAYLARAAPGETVRGVVRTADGSARHVEVFTPVAGQLLMRFGPPSELLLARLEGLFDTFPAGLAMLDRDLRYLRANRRLVEFHRCAPDAYSGRTVDEVLPQLAAQLRPSLQWVLEQGMPLLDVHVHVGEPDTADQRDWVEHYWPVHDAEGQVDAIGVLVQEFGPALRREAVRWFEREFHTAAENATEALSRFDRNLRRVYVNPAAAALFDLPRVAMLGRSTRELGVAPAFVEAHDALLQQVWATGERRRAELRLERADGRRIIEAEAIPEFDSAGRLDTVLAVLRDVTANRRDKARLRESERRFRHVMELAPTVLYRMPVPGSRPEFISPEVERLTGYSRREWQAESDMWSRLIHDEDREWVLAEFRQSLNDPTVDAYVQEYRLWHKDGRTLRWVEDRRRVERDSEGRALAIFGAVLDVTERKRTEQLMRLLEQEARLLAERSPDIISRIDESLRIVYASPAVARITGQPPEFYVGRTLGQIGLSERAAAAVEAAVRAALRGEESAIDYTVSTADGGERVLESRYAPDRRSDGDVLTVIGVTRDITHLREAETRLREEVEGLLQANVELADISQRDVLTGLANRRHLSQYLDVEWRREARHGSVISLVLGDIDHFKAYNDRYGHLAGDECLRQVAAALQAQVHRPGDLLARYGGEEFVLVLPQTPLSGAAQVAEALRQAVEDLALPHAGSPCGRVTISLGVAEGAPQQDSARDLFAAADRAMYAAKSGGRNRVCLAAPEPPEAGA